MLSAKVPQDELSERGSLIPTYARRALAGAVPRFEMPEGSMDPAAAYQLVHDELCLDGNPTLNLATFVTTWMEEQADRLMVENMNKNAIDWDEYPQTVELQDRCVNMLARLFGADEHHHSVGCATVGSSEAIHLAGLAMKWRWRAQRQAAGKPFDRPNVVMGANVQVCWEKFARYFDVEARMVPLAEGRYIIGVEEALAMVDQNTIGVVGILGSTYTGEYEPIAGLCEALDQLAERDGIDVPVHVDAASGGFVAPSLHPDLHWDFRLPRVHSINVSGHKYGLVYPGIGWVLWRDQEDLPKELIFEVDYLGGSHANFSLNFSRGAAQIVAQYYNLIRLGKTGYREIMTAMAATARWVADELEARDDLVVLTSGSDLPVVCFSLAGAPRYSVFDLSTQLHQRGWIVPAYKMAPNAEHVEVLRVVVREGLSRDLAFELVHDIKAALDRLGSEHHPERSDAPAAAPAPSHPRGSSRVTAPANRVKKTRAVC